MLGLSAGVLLELVQQRGFEIFVHPIPPVLNETRHVVMPFNHQLKQRVKPAYSQFQCPVPHRTHCKAQRA